MIEILKIKEDNKSNELILETLKLINNLAINQQTIEYFLKDNSKDQTKQFYDLIKILNLFLLSSNFIFKLESG